MELEDEKCVKVTDYVEIIGVVKAFYERLFKKEGVKQKCVDEDLDTLRAKLKERGYKYV